ncbi:MAG: type II secretion system F family protein [Coriobacteriales bacterium]|jgi:tight adherence protein C|nr:type II secretion system F family protein [Coriobacteriales bacterium]
MSILAFLTLENVIVFAIGVIVLAFWLFCYASGRKYAPLFEVLTEKEYPFKEIYFVGYGFLEKIHYTYKGKQNRKLRKEAEVLFGEKYADYFMRVIHAQKLSLSLTILVIAFVFYGFANDIMALVVVIAFAALAYYYFGTLAGAKIKKRSAELMGDFSEVVSKLALMTNAGMILKEAWEDVAFSKETILYKEMQLVVDNIRNGMSEIDALHTFGTRSMVPEIKKFASTLIQGLIKGNAELALSLQAQSKEVWSLKKQDVRRQGEKAASKLLIPMMIMFIGILIMLLVPVFANIGLS